MRNIIYTSITLCLLFGSAWAEPNLGCYARIYNVVHLEAYPEQVVASMRLELIQADGSEGMNAAVGSVISYLDVVLANQGHVARNDFPDEDFPDGFGGQTMYQVFRCDVDSRFCHQSCMGSTDESSGFEVLSNDGKTLILRLSSLMVGKGQACGGYTDIANVPGKSVTFVLDRVDTAICEQEWD